MARTKYDFSELENDAKKKAKENAQEDKESSKYDFSELEELINDATKTQRVDPDEPRIGLQQVKCCGNCKHYWYLFSSPRNGWCRLPNPDVFVKRDLVATLDRGAVKAAGWLATHSTLGCQNWAPGQTWQGNTIAKFTEIKFQVNGEIAPEEMQETEIGKRAARLLR